MWKKSRAIYSAIPTHTAGAEDVEKLRFGTDDHVGDASVPQCPQTRAKARSPWIVSTLFFALSTASLLINQFYGSVGSFEHGFKTDLAAIRSTIKLNEVTFTGSPSFTDNGEEYVEIEPGQKQYVGEPNPIIDENWRELTKERYFLLTAHEALSAWGPEYVDYWDEDHGGYLAGLDMFHTLHCLDHLRQSFYPEYYPQTPIHGVLHRDHCIDHLRQMIMCSADVTPIPTKFFTGISQNYIDSNRKHTCRDFSAIRSWVSERFREDDLIAESH